MPTPDNMELNSEGKLWVASPLSNQIYSIDPENGESYVVFDAQTAAGANSVIEGLLRSEIGEGIVDLLVPETIGDMPGLLTGMIIGESPESFHIANLGEALVKVSVKQP